MIVAHQTAACLQFLWHEAIRDIFTPTRMGCPRGHGSIQDISRKRAHIVLPWEDETAELV